MEAPPKAPVPMCQTMLDLINHSMRHSPTGIALSGQVYQLNRQDLEVLDNFSNRSVLTFGSNVTKWIFQVEAPRLACLVSQPPRIDSSFQSYLSAASHMRLTSCR